MVSSGQSKLRSTPLLFFSIRFRKARVTAVAIDIGSETRKA